MSAEDDYSWRPDGDMNDGARRGHQHQFSSTSRDEYTFDDDDGHSDIYDEQAPASYEEATNEDNAIPLETYSNADLSRLEASLLDTAGEDYYAILNLPRTPSPTDAQIRSAFHTISLSFHPDKQPHVLQNVAKDHFARVKTAYETLIDPQKRIVYDLLGAEGVKKQWAPGGVMGRDGEGETLSTGSEVGTRAMEPEEFRRWFLRIMKRRERLWLQSLVESRGLLGANINLSSMFTYDDFDEKLYIGYPDLYPTHVNMHHSFVTPLPWLSSIWPWSQPTKKSLENDDVEDSEDEEDGHRIVITSGLSAVVKRPRRIAKLELPNGEIVEQTIENDPILLAPDFSLRASTDHVFSNEPTASSRISRWLSGGVLHTEATVLPRLGLQSTFSTFFTPVKGTRPIALQVTVTKGEDSRIRPPTLSLYLARKIGLRKTAYCTLFSGSDHLWPGFIQALIAPEFATVSPGTSHSFNIGLRTLSAPEHGTTATSDNLDEDEEQTEGTQPHRSKPIKRQNLTEYSLEASPAAGLGFTIKHSRDFFGSRVEEPLRSEWTSEGREVQPADLGTELRPLRFEVTMTVREDLQTSVTLVGTRRFGDFTRAGIGIGFTGGFLVSHIEWKRLGQEIRVPIVLAKIDVVGHDAAAFCMALPWVVYTAIEYGYTRPQARKKRWQAIQKRKQQLKKLIAKRKEESVQAVALMNEQVQRRQYDERSRDGLVILEAKYGPSRTKNKKRKSRVTDGFEAEWIDVTIPVAGLVVDGRLIISRNLNWNAIQGFYDPAPLVPKALRIRYLFGNHEHVVEVEEDEDLICPMSTHNMDIDAVN